ncbi:MAG: acyl-CoA dehydrogenase family protein [Halioglobus sp.]|nr:acyl-CoA dehydrogenase family protein [Halioglobus sp.]
MNGIVNIMENLSPDELDDFRQSVRAWLEANCPASMRTPASDEDDMVWGGSKVSFKTKDHQLWFERMRDKGWFTPDWPTEYGGGGLSSAQAQILTREMARLHCRQPQINLGIWMLGPVLLEFGTQEQKQTHLPPMARGEVRWCQGFSEPNAGSDLASLQMKAVPDGDDFIVTGSKIWTSHADKSDAIYTLVRTDPNAKKQEGISFLLIDMTSPGITTQPIELISGKSHFCEVFFDQVRVPQKNLVGELNGGWTVAKRLMQHERHAMAHLGDEGLSPYSLADMAKKYLGCRTDGATGADPASTELADAVMRDRIAALDMDDMAYQLTLRRAGEEIAAGGDATATTSTFKYYSTELEKRKNEALIAILGTRGLGWDEQQSGGEANSSFTEEELAVTRGWLASKVMSIGGGTTEIQLNVIAKRVLGLPSASDCA